MMQRMSKEEFLNWRVYYELKAEEAAKREEELKAEEAAKREEELKAEEAALEAKHNNK